MPTPLSDPSIVNYLASAGQATDFASRAKLAAEKGITNYSGTAAQNTQLLNALRTTVSAAAPLPADAPTVTAPEVPGSTPPPPAMSTQRDSAREAATAKIFGAPATAADKELQDRKTYTPDELKAMGLYQNNTPTPAGAQQPQAYNPALLKSMGLTDEQIAALGPSQGFQVNQDQATANGTYQPTNMGIRVLEDALKARGDIGNQEIGTSNIFEQAGLTGMGALGASLASRQTEMKATYDDFLDGVTRISDALKDKYTAATKIYQQNKDLFDNTVKSLVAYNQKAQDAKDAISLIEKKHTLDMEETEFAAKMQAKYRAPSGGGSGDDDAKRQAITQGLALAAASNAYGEVSAEDYNAAKQSYLDQKLGTAADFENTYGYYVTRGRPTANNNLEYNLSR